MIPPSRAGDKEEREGREKLVAKELNFSTSGRIRTVIREGKRKEWKKDKKRKRIDKDQGVDVVEEDDEEKKEGKRGGEEKDEKRLKEQKR